MIFFTPWILIFLLPGELCQGVRVQGRGELDGAGREGDLQNAQVKELLSCVYYSTGYFFSLPLLTHVFGGSEAVFCIAPNPPQLNFWGRIFNDWNICTRLKDCQAWYVNDQNLCKKRELIATDATELAGYLRSGFNSVGIWCFCTLSPLSCKLVLNSGMTQSTRWLECFLKRSQWTKAGLLMLERWRDNKIIEFMQNTLWIGRN